MVYVPYYNPVVVYGTWWWPTYQPVYWAPWPGYYSRAGYARGYAWGPGIAVSAGFFFGAPDWQHRHVTVVNVNNYYYRPVNRESAAGNMRGALSSTASGSTTSRIAVKRLVAMLRGVNPPPVLWQRLRHRATGARARRPFSPLRRRWSCSLKRAVQ